MTTENSNTNDLELLIAADTHAVLAGLKEINNHTDFKCNIRTAHTFDELKQILSTYQIEILVIGITNEKEWFDKIIDLTNNRKYKDVKVIVFSNRYGSYIINKLREFGIKGFLKDTATRSEIVEILNAVRNGNSIFPEPEDTTPPPAKKRRTHSGIYIPKQSAIDILELVRKKKRYKEIADLLHIPKGTVHDRIQAFRKGSGTHTSAQDIAWLIENGHMKP